MLKRINCPSCNNETKILKNWRFIDLDVTYYKCNCGMSLTQYRGSNLEKYFKNVKRDDIFVIDNNKKLRKITEAETKI